MQIKSILRHIGIFAILVTCISSASSKKKVPLLNASESRSQLHDTQSEFEKSSQAFGRDAFGEDEFNAIQSETSEQSIGDRVFFGFDKSTVEDADLPMIQRLAEYFNSKDNANYQIQISGHCDTRGFRSYNLALGSRRAKGTREAFIKSGVDPSRIETASYGMDKPVISDAEMDGKAPEERGKMHAQNRRSEIKLLTRAAKNQQSYNPNENSDSNDQESQPGYQVVSY